MTYTVYMYSAYINYNIATKLYLPRGNLYFQTYFEAEMHSNLQPQSMSPQMPILLRTEH